MDLRDRRRCVCRAVRRAAPRLTVALVVMTAAGCDVKVGDEGVSVGVAAGRAEDAWTRRYTLPPAGEVQIVSINGPVEVGPSADGQVEVRVVREARAASDAAARDALDRVQIVEEAGPGRVSVTVRPSEEGEGERRGRRGVTNRIAVRVPDGLVLSISAQNGSIQAENVSGRLTAAGSNGSFRAAGLSGGLSASVVNGAVDVEFASFEEAAELTVVNGGIRLVLPVDTRATLAGTITNGRLDVDDSFTLAGAPQDRAFAGQQRLGGTINGPGPVLTIQATNGSVRIVRRTATADPPRGR